MLRQRYILLCLFVYFLSLYLFFTSQFVSYQQIDGVSTESLLQKPSFKYEKMEGNLKRPQEEIGQKLQSINLNFIDIEQKQAKQSKQEQSYPSVSQVVLIIIDALRYDYLSKIKFFQQTLSSFPQTSIAKKCIVGLPTMTTQRVQSLMTGSEIFTSTNILDMFLSSKTKADNLIDQIYRKKKRVKVFGDDTWTKLFSFAQEDTKVCDSTFNIRDYDGCDQLVYDGLNKQILRQQKEQVKHIQTQHNQVKHRRDNNLLLIAHFLALDHIGHATSSIIAPQMQDRMDKMSIFFEYLIKVAKNDTMFIITGDHGMRQDGNHGGGLNVQKQTLFFAYYKKGDDQQQQQKMDIRQRIKNFESTFVNQVDITSTLSVLLDVPNPMNSVGYPICQIMPSRFLPYIRNIQYNTLQHYNKIIQHYNPIIPIQSPQLQSSSQSQNVFSCVQSLRNLLIKIQQQVLSDQPSLPEQINQNKQFNYHMQRKQFIKVEIQLTQCLNKKLGRVDSKQGWVEIGLIGMGVMSIIIIVLVIYDKLEGIVIKAQSNNIQDSSQIKSPNNKPTHILNINKSPNQYIKQNIHLLIIQISSLFLSLFTIYFSWYLIRNSSSYLLILIVAYIVLLPLKCLEFDKKVQLIFLLVILTQFQSEKVNQYELNIINFQLGNRVLQYMIQKFPSNQINQLTKQDKIIQIKKWISFIVVSIWIIIKIKVSFIRIKVNKRLIRLKKRINKKNNSSQLSSKQSSPNKYSSASLNQLCPVQQQQQQQHKQTSISLFDSYLQIFLIVLFYTNYIICAQIIQNSLYTNYIYWTRYLIFSLLLVYIISGNNADDSMSTNGISTKNRSKNSINRSNKSKSEFVIVVGYGVVFGMEGFLVLLLFLSVIKVMLQQSKDNRDNLVKNTKVIKSYTNKQRYGFQGKTVLLSLICEYIWWLLGNKYQYSSVDIKKSYLFSSQFNIYLNPISMLMWFIAPYVIAVAMIDQRLCCVDESCELDELSQKCQKTTKTVNMHSVTAHFNYPHYLSSTQPQSTSLLPHQSLIYASHKSLTNDNYDPTTQLTKYVLPQLLGLFSASLNLYCNQGKILFTVVYVPLMVLGMVKVIGIIGVSGVIVWKRGKSQVNKQKQGIAKERKKREVYQK